MNLTTIEKTSVTRIRINQSGYDDSGQYWGCGGRLYRVDDPSLDYPKFYRADDRDGAKEAHSYYYPNAIYYR